MGFQTIGQNTSPLHTMVNPVKLHAQNGVSATKKELSNAKAKRKKGKVVALHLSLPEDLEEDLQEAKKPWDLGKLLGLYTEIEEEEIENL